MKKIFVSLLAFVMAVSAFARDHSTDPDSFYLTVEEMPSSLAILMSMPADTTARFAYDREQYEWGKSIRNTPRGKMAISDAYVDSTYLDRTFSEAFGRPITKKATPVLYKLLSKATNDAGGLSTSEAKAYYHRVRPFVYWNEHTSVPDTEKDLINNGSYPSGHTAIGWCVALILADINPARATEILKRGFEYGQSRVIVGAHYQSDVDAGRVMGAAAFVALLSNPEFVKDLEAARAEFRNSPAVK